MVLCLDQSAQRYEAPNVKKLYGHFSSRFLHGLPNKHYIACPLFINNYFNKIRLFEIIISTKLLIYK